MTSCDMVLLVSSYGETPCLAVVHRMCNHARDKTVKVLWSNVDMRCVVLRPTATPAVVLSETLGKCAEVSRFAREADRQEDSNRRSSKDLFKRILFLLSRNTSSL